LSALRRFSLAETTGNNNFTLSVNSTSQKNH